MRRLRRLVFVLAAVVAAFWLLGDRLSLQKEGLTTKPAGVEKSIPELTGRGGAAPLDHDDRAALASEQSKVGAPRDVTDAKREELITYLHERWPTLMIDYDFQGIELTSWDPDDGGHVGYVAVFGSGSQASSPHGKKPVIGCGYSFERETWHCISPVFEPAPDDLPPAD